MNAKSPLHQGTSTKPDNRSGGSLSTKTAPANASELEAALFYAFRSCERIPGTAMQLHNIAHHRQHS